MTKLNFLQIRINKREQLSELIAVTFLDVIKDHISYDDYYLAKKKLYDVVQENEIEMTTKDSRALDAANARIIKDFKI